MYTSSPITRTQQSARLPVAASLLRSVASWIGETSVRMDEEFCATIIELVLPFQDLDLAERRGFLSKFRKS